jgi:hypothetical protein
MTRIVLISGVMALLALPVMAEDASIQDQVAQARQTCRADQSRMAALERSAHWCTDDPKVIQARDTAERSCGEAMKLMVTAGMEPQPKAPQPAPPTPSITISEKVRVAAASAPSPQVEVAQFAAMEVDCPPEQRGTATR